MARTGAGELGLLTTVGPLPEQGVFHLVGCRGWCC
jgi:hypothetical protein